MIVKYQWILSGTYLVSIFSTWSHILEVSDTLSFILDTSYLLHHRILLDGRLLFFSIIVKFL